VLEVKGMRKMFFALGVLLGAIVLAAGFALANWFIFSRAEAEIHLIPDGYVGPVVIAFDRDDGEPQEYENKTRIYGIPSNGVLKTKFPKNDGTDHVWKFYYMKADGTKRELPYFLDLREVPAGSKDTVAIYSLASMSAPSSRGASDRNFFTYVVGKVSDSKSLIDRQHNINFSDL
jgi:hypothetical protein